MDAGGGGGGGGGPGGGGAAAATDGAGPVTESVVNCLGLGGAGGVTTSMRQIEDTLSAEEETA